jgi:hypothetical protein
MHSAVVPIFAVEPQDHKASNAIEALWNLMYLIRVDAADPSNVIGYVRQAESVLEQMQGLMLGDYPC